MKHVTSQTHYTPMRQAKNRITPLILAIVIALSTALPLISFNVAPVYASSFTQTNLAPHSVFSADMNWGAAAIANDGSLYAWGMRNIPDVGRTAVTPTRVLDSAIHVTGRFAITSDGVLRRAPLSGVNAGEAVLDSVSYFRSSGVGTVNFAIRTDGSLWGWGANNHFGQLGDGTTRQLEEPVRVMDSVVYITAAHSLRAAGASPMGGTVGGSSFAIRENGQLWAWGCNYHGQLGDGSRTDRLSPVLVMESVTSVVTNYGSTYAIRADGSLWAWGRNYLGQLGDGTTTNRRSPVWVMDYVKQVAAYPRSNVAFALRVDGSLWAWGDNTWGRFGDGSQTEHVSGRLVQRIQPRPVRIMDNVRYVATGGSVSFAIRTDDSLWAWGDRHQGGVGDGYSGWDVDPRWLPVRIMDSVAHVESAIGGTFAIRTDGGLWGWGPNSDGVLGLGHTDEVNTPTLILSNVRLPGTAVQPPPLLPQDGVTIVRTPACFAAMSGPQSAGRTFRLANPITLTQPIVDFRGTFDGGGHVITLTMRDEGRLFTTAGLFSDINEGEVVIRNLGVETGTGEIRANSISNQNSRAFAGGLVGVVTGGNLTIENVYFHGNVRARADFDRRGAAIGSAVSNAVRFLIGDEDLTFSTLDTAAKELLGSWFVMKYVKLGRSIFDATMDLIMGNGARAYAGGLIGMVGSDANVRIINSYARGTVSARGYLSFLDLGGHLGVLRAYADAGGLVGIRTGNARVTVENSYVFNNISAHADTAVVGAPRSNAGALVGRSTASVQNTAYRWDRQSLAVNSVGLIFTRSGTTNTHGITSSLTQTAMQDRNSFVGWDFNSIWGIGPSRNTGFPHLQVFAQEFVPEFLRPLGSFANGFVSIQGSNAPLTLSVDMPASQLVSVLVNGTYLTQNTHFTVQSGSTQVTLLPAFLDSLHDGFHTLTVIFEDGIFAEEQFMVVEAAEMSAPISRLYVDGNLIYTAEGGLLVDESRLDAIYQAHQTYKIEFEDGTTVDYANHIATVSFGGRVIETVAIDRGTDNPSSAAGDFDSIIWIVAIAAVVAFGVIITVVVKTTRKR